jgi:hypothetical protein
MTGERSSAWRSRLLRTGSVVGLCLVSGIVGGALNRNFGISSYTLAYADFVSIMLTAVSLLITVLAVFLAVAGFVGWTTIEQKVHAKTEDFLAKGFERGGRLDSMVVERVTTAIRSKTEELMFEGVERVDIDAIADGEGEEAT